MEARQKRILIYLGVVDLLVIVLLGGVVWRSLPPRTPSVVQRSFAPCEKELLAQLPAYLSPAVSWQSEQLYVALIAQYAAPTPPESSAQLLWETLDGLAALDPQVCPLPAKIVLVVTAAGEENTIGHLAHLSGADLTAWQRGALSAEQLAARAAYSLVGRATTRALLPGPWHYPR